MGPIHRQQPQYTWQNDLVDVSAQQAVETWTSPACTAFSDYAHWLETQITPMKWCRNLLHEQPSIKRAWRNGVFKDVWQPCICLYRFFEILNLAAVNLLPEEPRLSNDELRSSNDLQPTISGLKSSNDKLSATVKHVSQLHPSKEQISMLCPVTEMSSSSPL
jgi:hypothetical protein